MRLSLITVPGDPHDHGIIVNSVAFHAYLLLTSTLSILLLLAKALQGLVPALVGILLVPLRDLFGVLHVVVRLLDTFILQFLCKQKKKKKKEKEKQVSVRKRSEAQYRSSPTRLKNEKSRASRMVPCDALLPRPACSRCLPESYCAQVIRY